MSPMQSAMQLKENEIAANQQAMYSIVHRSLRIWAVFHIKYNYCTGPFVRANHLTNKNLLKYSWLTPTERSDTGQITWFFLESTEIFIRLVLCKF